MYDVPLRLTLFPVSRDAPEARINVKGHRTTMSLHECSIRDSKALGFPRETRNCGPTACQDRYPRCSLHVLTRAPALCPGHLTFCVSRCLRERILMIGYNVGGTTILCNCSNITTERISLHVQSNIRYQIIAFSDKYFCITFD